MESTIAAHATISRFMMLNGLVPLQVTYEQLTGYPRKTGQVLCAYLGRPGLACDPAKVSLRRQATGLNRAWRTRFLAEEAAMTATERARVYGRRDAVHYRRVTLAELAADPAIRIEGQPAAVALPHLPAVTVPVPPLAFGDAGPAAAGVSVDHPAVPAWRLRNVAVHGASGIVTARDCVIAETVDGVPADPIEGAARASDGGLWLPPRLDAANFPSAVHLLDHRHDHYPCWLLDLVARFSATAFEAQRSVPGAPRAPVVLTPPLDVFWKWESLGAMLPDGVPQVAVGPDGRVFVQRLLYVPRLGTGRCSIHPAVAPVFDAVRQIAGRSGRTALRRRPAAVARRAAGVGRSAREPGRALGLRRTERAGDDHAGRTVVRPLGAGLRRGQRDRGAVGSGACQSGVLPARHRRLRSAGGGRSGLDLAASRRGAGPALWLSDGGRRDARHEPAGGGVARPAVPWRLTCRSRFIAGSGCRNCSRPGSRSGGLPAGLICRRAAADVRRNRSSRTPRSSNRRSRERADTSCGIRRSMPTCSATPSCGAISGWSRATTW